jgi:hypothetical protein
MRMSGELSTIGRVVVQRSRPEDDVWPTNPPRGTIAAMAAQADPLPDWEQLLSAERHLQRPVLVLGRLAEMARIKAWLLLTRHTVRDYLDTVVLLERLGETSVPDAFGSFDDIYPQTSGASPLAELCERLAAAAPQDVASVDLATYRRLRPPWNDWAHVCERGRHWAVWLAPVALGGDA